MDLSFNRRVESKNLAGKEIYEIKPVILGGSPTDPANKTVLTRQQHIEAVRYWNKVIRDLRRTRDSRTGVLYVQTNERAAIDKAGGLGNLKNKKLPPDPSNP